jgi:hypothetical protein
METKKYDGGKIYVVRNNENDRVYVGSTIQSLSKRMYEHKHSTTNYKKDRKLYSAMNTIGFGKFYIELVETYPCKTKEELLSREGHYIREFDSVTNGYNSAVAGRSQSEYYENNKENILKRNQLYRDLHKSDIQITQKNWYEQNKDILSEEVLCKCGGKYRKSGGSKDRHLRTNKHTNWVNKQK